MGDGVSFNSANKDKFKVDFKKFFDFRTSYAVETSVPTVDLNGNGNWGVGDGFELYIFKRITPIIPHFFQGIRLHYIWTK